tara:strand:- start:20390 stop:22171 length:1782 start_codon:yes stop_codon:yes gene_type:complete
MNKVKFNKSLFEFYSIFILFAVFAPKLNAVDNVSLRWLTVASVNLVFLSYILISKKKYYLKISNVLKIFTGLFIVSVASTINSLNINESLISLNKIFIVLSTIVCVSVLINKKESLQSLTYILFISVLFESLYVFYDYFTSSDLNFSGVSMNRNISSFSILVKVPFIYIYQSLNQNQNKLISILYELIVILSIILLESRAAIFILTLIFILKAVFLKDKIRSFISLCLIVLTVIIYYPFSRVLQGKDIISSNIMLDESLSLRFDFFSHAIELFLNNPLIGNGVGMWKVLSNQMKLSQVPYYVHNDFLQFLIETGAIGFIMYILFFFSIFYSIKKQWNNSSIYILLASLIFLIDSLINFPFHRPQQIIIFILIIGSIISSLDLKKIEFKNSYLFILIITLVISNYLSFKVLNGSFIENRFRVDLIKNEFSFDKTELEKLEYQLPNLTSNTVPFSSYIARYYLNFSEYSKADQLIDIGINYNPYLSYPRDIKLQSLLEQNNLLEALRVAKYQLYNSNQTEAYLQIIFSISSELNLENEFVDLYDKILSLNNSDLLVEYFLNYKKINGLNQTNFNKLLFQSIAVFPKNQDLLKILN